MLGVSDLIGNSSADGAAAEAPESGGASGGSTSEVGGPGGGGTVPGSFSEEEKSRIADEVERSSGGNRWPRQETLALLKIRSDMDVTFRDSSLKGPLWEEVSRKMAELGFHRSAKKCKEKFENVYKYHKRTKDGRASKPDGKTYRFFDQLEALENNPPQSLHHAHIGAAAANSLPPPPRSQPLMPAATATATMTVVTMPPSAGNVNHPAGIPPSSHHHHHHHHNNNQGSSTVSSPNPISVAHSIPMPISSSLPPSQPLMSVSAPPLTTANPPQGGGGGTFLPTHHHPNISATSFLSDSTSSSTSSDEDIQRRHRRKRKWKDFFERLMSEVIHKQEEMQKRFLEALEKRERDRMSREESWRVQEIARMNREHDLLVQERSMAAAKDAAVIAFLQKVTEQQNPNSNAPQTQIQLPEIRLPTPTPPQPPLPQPQPLSQPVQQPPVAPQPQPIAATPVQQIISVPQAAPPPAAVVHGTPPPKHMEIVAKPDNNGGDSYLPVSSSRWPKAEVQALIQLRTDLDLKYQESGPKGPLWEEISASMKKLGYNRNAKRCKEKWENINKYFKKVKESNKKRPEDSKTCPYFHQLDAIYREKAKGGESNAFGSPPSGYNAMKPDSQMVPIMARPEQQWPLPPQDQQQRQPGSAVDDNDSDNMDRDDHDDDGDDDDDEEDEGGGYEMVANKGSSVPTSME